MDYLSASFAGEGAKTKKSIAIISIVPGVV